MGLGVGSTLLENNPSKPTMSSDQPQVGQHVIEVRVFLDNGSYQFANTISRFEVKPGNNAPIPVRLGEV